MSDLVERLNKAANSSKATPVGTLWNLCDEAADEIEKLRKEILDPLTNPEVKSGYEMITQELLTDPEVVAACDRYVIAESFRRLSVRCASLMKEYTESQKRYLKTWDDNKELTRQLALANEAASAYRNICTAYRMGRMPKGKDLDTVRGIGGGE